MRKSLRHAARRQREIGFFVIVLLLLAPAEAFGLRYGRGAVLVLWAGLVVILELLYRWLVSVEARNRRKWWARPRKRVGLRFYGYCGCTVLAILIESPFTRYALLALLAAGLLCAGIIHLLHREGEL